MRAAAGGGPSGALGERAPQGRGGEVKIQDAGEGELSAIKDSFYKRVSASHEELTSPGRDLVLL